MLFLSSFRFEEDEFYVSKGMAEPWTAGQPYDNFQVQWTREDYNREKYSPRKVRPHHIRPTILAKSSRHNAVICLY